MFFASSYNFLKHSFMMNPESKSNMMDYFSGRPTALLNGAIVV